MTKIRQSFTSALAGAFGLRPDERALWPDMVLGAFLAFALVFSLGSFVTFVFDITFFVSTLVAIVLILLAREKRAVLGGALLFVGLRSLIAAVIAFQWRAAILLVISFGFGGILLQGYLRNNDSDE